MIGLPELKKPMPVYLLWGLLTKIPQAPDLSTSFMGLLRASMSVSSRCPNVTAPSFQCSLANPMIPLPL